ncbi:hypothetical protein TEA_013891 [Camellia sinensis var. sinensis]|uniref:ethanolamine-phosphate cytidylyltransferase n=1 Tax=Camellia sinensis var. sinensis TaxID=542762 RepID=A0A4S4E2Y7_CAMSN|nr:hypothetical protein TEA_013891 [Camellia sinensis var. sinensis]
MELDCNGWMWDGVYYYPHLFGGVMLTAALLGLSTGYFGGISVPSLPYFLPDLRIFHKNKSGRKRTRVYMDGCFDLMHYGHANALRQAKSLGDELVVGVVSDEEIIANKGPPVLSMEERFCDPFLKIDIQQLRSEFLVRVVHICVRRKEGEKACNAEFQLMISYSHVFCLMDASSILSLCQYFPASVWKMSFSNPLVSFRQNDYSSAQLCKLELVLVSGLKWVDDVITNAPYAITEEFMNRLFNEHKIDYIIHGDDPCLLPDGTDAYALAKKVGRYKQIKRTEGVSSTEIVGRILASAKEIKVRGSQECSSLHGEPHNLNSIQGEESRANGDHISHFLPTSRRIVQFSNGSKGPGPNARVVYIDGAFDLFHAGHVEILKSARQLGDFLLVGIHSDHIVSNGGASVSHRASMLAGLMFQPVLYYGIQIGIITGLHLMPLNMHNDTDRAHVRNLLAITTFNISLVVHGTVAESNTFLNGKTDPYAVPKSMGIFQMLQSPKNITTTSVAQRILANHEVYVQALEIPKYVAATPRRWEQGSLKVRDSFSIYPGYGPISVVPTRPRKPPWAWYEAQLLFPGKLGSLWLAWCHKKYHCTEAGAPSVKRNAKKEASEKKYYAEKKHVSGD